MTTLAELRDKVANDIRDPLFATFTESQVDALINAGVNEVSRVYPKELLDDVTLVADTYSYATEARQVFRVEHYRDNRVHALLYPNEADSSQGGWEVFAGEIHLPQGFVDHASIGSDFVRLWGYGERAQLTADAQVLDADADGEWGIRYYARWQAFQAMLHDRALFKQWQGVSQNTDITPAQLQQDVLTYAGEWERHRNRLRRLRRV